MTAALAEDDEDLDIENAVVTPMEDGGAVVDFAPPAVAPASDPNADFKANLTDLFDEAELDKLGLGLVQLVDEDDRSRADWRTAYARGLGLLGLKYEERADPWVGACGAYHPLLLEAVLRFNAEAMKDYFPGSGPVKVKVEGTLTEEAERQMNRVRKDLNYILSETMVGFYSETDMMLFDLALAGSTFRKWRFDEQYHRPVAEYLITEHVVIPYAASSLESADRFALKLVRSQNWLASKQETGFYRDVDIPKANKSTSESQEAKDRIEGRTDNTILVDEVPNTFYEVYTKWYFEEDTFNPTKLQVPYIITVDKDSSKVLAIRRDWREQDPTFQRPPTVVQHKYLHGVAGRIAFLRSVEERPGTFLLHRRRSETGDFLVFFKRPLRFILGVDVEVLLFVTLVFHPEQCIQPRDQLIEQLGARNSSHCLPPLLSY